LLKDLWSVEETLSFDIEKVFKSVKIKDHQGIKCVEKEEGINPKELQNKGVGNKKSQYN
jgi:hypothetical protein